MTCREHGLSYRSKFRYECNQFMTSGDNATHSLQKFQNAHCHLLKSIDGIVGPHIPDLPACFKAECILYNNTFTKAVLIQ
jgi:hypothetical protein